MQPLLQLYTGAQMKRTQNLALLVVILGAWGLTTVNAQTPNMQGDQMKSSSKMNSNPKQQSPGSSANTLRSSAPAQQEPDDEKGLDERDRHDEV